MIEENSGFILVTLNPRRSLKDKGVTSSDRPWSLTSLWKRAISVVIYHKYVHGIERDLTGRGMLWKRRDRKSKLSHRSIHCFADCIFHQPSHSVQIHCFLKRLFEKLLFFLSLFSFSKFKTSSASLESIDLWTPSTAHFYMKPAWCCQKKPVSHRNVSKVCLQVTCVGCQCPLSSDIEHYCIT